MTTIHRLSLHISVHIHSQKFIVIWWCNIHTPPYRYRPFQLAAPHLCGTNDNAPYHITEKPSLLFFWHVRGGPFNVYAWKLKRLDWLLSRYASEKMPLSWWRCAVLHECHGRYVLRFFSRLFVVAVVVGYGVIVPVRIWECAAMPIIRIVWCVKMA